MKILSWILVNYILKAAIRDRLMVSLPLIVVIGTCLAVFMGSGAIIEKDQFALVFAAGGLRFAGVIGLVLFVVFYMRRCFEAKDVEYLLSRPISRIAFIFSHSLAFSILAAVMAVFIIGAACLIAPAAIGAGYFLWGLSLIAEFVIIVNVALFFSMVLSSASSSSLAVFAFYVLARMMGHLLGIIDADTLSFSGFEILSFVMQGVSLIIPRLDLMAQTSWLIYGPQDGDIGILFIATQGVVYSFLVIMASLFDLIRRQF